MQTDQSPAHPHLLVLTLTSNLLFLAIFSTLFLIFNGSIKPLFSSAHIVILLTSSFIYLTIMFLKLKQRIRLDYFDPNQDVFLSKSTFKKLKTLEWQYAQNILMTKHFSVYTAIALLISLFTSNNYLDIFLMILFNILYTSLLNITAIISFLTLHNVSLSSIRSLSMPIQSPQDQDLTQQQIPQKIIPQKSTKTSSRKKKKKILIDLTKNTHQTSVKIDIPSHPSEFSKQLNDYLYQVSAQLLGQHYHQIQSAIKIFNDIKITQDTSNLSQQKNEELHAFQQKCLARIKQDIDTYIAFDSNKRKRGNVDLHMVPNAWLTRQLLKHATHLVQKITFLYQDDLQSFIDHQTFVEQQFKNDEPDFITHTTQSQPNSKNKH